MFAVFPYWIDAVLAGDLDKTGNVLVRTVISELGNRKPNGMQNFLRIK